MNREALPILVLLVLSGIAPVVEADMISQVYHRDLPEGLLERVDSHFPGNGRLDDMLPAMFTAEANLHLTQRTTISLTFLDEAAGYHNEIGYLEFDDQGQLISQTTVFGDYSKANGGGTLTAGDTIDIGTFEAGTNVGFYLIPNGNSGRSAHTTLDSLNPGQENYTGYYFDETSGYGILGFEDLVNKNTWGLGYNDALVGISTSVVPEPATIGLLIMGVLVLAGRRQSCRREQI